MLINSLYTSGLRLQEGEGEGGREGGREWEEGGRGRRVRRVGGGEE